MVRDYVKVRLELESHPENVALVRSTLTGVAEAVNLGDELIADLKTAVSEACNNVSLHAYDDTSGPMLVEIDTSSSGVNVAVVDHGQGINRLSSGEDHMGLGLAVISALADSSEFRHPEGGGTEVRMWFRQRDAGGDPIEPSAPDAPPHELPGPPTEGARGREEVRVSLAPTRVTRYVLYRIVQSLAASSHFSLARLTDLREVNDAIARFIERAADGSVSISLSSSARQVEIISGPLPELDPDSLHHALGDMVDYLSAGPDLLHLRLLDETHESG